MQRPHPGRAAALALMAALLLASACAGSTATTEPIDPFEAAARRANNLPALTVVSPEAGSTVTAPFTIVIEAENLTLAPKGAVRDGQAHLHVITSGECVPAGEVIDDDDFHSHYGDGAAELDVDLPPGDYDLCVQAGDGFHVALGITVPLSVTVAG